MDKDVHESFCNMYVFFLFPRHFVTLNYIPFIDREMRLRFLLISTTFTLTC